MMLYQEDLDNLPCGNPACDHTSHEGPMFLHSQCHTGKGVVAKYEKGVIEITCRICKQLVAKVAVGKRNVLKDAVIACRVIGDSDGNSVTWTMAGVDMQMETEQFLRIMEYLETFRESYILHRASLKQ